MFTPTRLVVLCTMEESFNTTVGVVELAAEEDAEEEAAAMGVEGDAAFSPRSAAKPLAAPVNNKTKTAQYCLDNLDMCLIKVTPSSITQERNISVLAFAESRSATPASMGCSSLGVRRPRSAAEGHYRGQSELYCSVRLMP